MSAEPGSGQAAGCRLLEWDSTFFGRVIARIEPEALIRDPQLVESWCRSEKVACGYLLADAADQPAIDAAQAAGFHLVDVRLTMDIPLTMAPRPARSGSVVVRPVAPADVDGLRTIARASHHNTRFYVDSHFDRARADDLYDFWITKSCGGWAAAVVVVEIDGRVAGYATCHRRPAEGEIGLVAVDTNQRNRGAGTALVQWTLDWFASAGLNRVVVVTQGRNASALHLYRKSGFGVRSIELWFHKWW